jgi:hypothetical protein
MTVKTYRERGKNKKSMWMRGLTLTRIILHHHKNFRRARPKRKRNDNNRAISDATTVLS